MLDISVRVVAVFAMWAAVLLAAVAAGVPVAGAEPAACAGAGATLVVWGFARARTRARTESAPAALAERPVRASA